MNRGLQGLRGLVAAIAAWGCLAGVGLLWIAQGDTRADWVALVVAGLVGWAAWRATALVLQASVRPWTAIWALIVASAASVAAVLGSRIDLGRQPPVLGPREQIPVCVGLSLAAWSVLIVALHWWDGVGSRRVAARAVQPRHRGPRWVLATSVLVLAWGIRFLRLYPGVVTADSFDSLDQVTGAAPLVNNHPVGFTALVALAVKPGLALGASLTQAIAAYSLLQLVLVGIALGYVVSWAGRQGWARVMPWLLLAWFALDPVLGTYAVTMWKDVPFCGAVLVLFTLLHDVARGRTRGWSWRRTMLTFGGVGLAVLLFRGNGVFVVGLSLAGVLLASRRPGRRVAAALMVALTLFGGLQLGLRAAHVPSAPATEALAIPLQQVAHAYGYGQVTDADRQRFSAFAPDEVWRTSYQPGIADAIKFHPEFRRDALAQHRNDFTKAWVSLGLRNPRSYLDAWLAQTVGYWDVGRRNWVVPRQVHPDSRRAQVETLNLLTGVRGPDSGKAALQEAEDVTVTPGLSAAYGIAVSVWLALIWALVHGRRHPRLLLAALPLLGVWLSMLLGAPVFCEFRYMFAFHLAAPVLLLSLLQPRAAALLTEPPPPDS